MDISNNIINVINDFETELENITNNTGFSYQQFTGQPLNPIFHCIQIQMICLLLIHLSII